MSELIDRWVYLDPREMNDTGLDWGQDAVNYILELEYQLKSRLIDPCECNGVGMCVPCAMRERVAGGEDIESVVKDYE